VVSITVQNLAGIDAVFRQRGRGRFNILRVWLKNAYLRPKMFFGV